MNQIYKDASEAMHAAYQLSKLLHKPVFRHTGVDSRGASIWIVSLERDSAIALQGLLA